MNKIFEALLKSYKRANHAARQKMAIKYGFKTTAEFEDYLNMEEKAPKVELSKKPGKKKNQPEQKLTVHNVHILDASGSMSGPKIKSAIEGINFEMEELKKDDVTEVTQTIVHFSWATDIETYCWKIPIAKANKFHCGSRGATALLQTVGETLTKLLSEVKDNEKVLVKIFTDGCENNSSGEFRNPKVVADLIKKCETKGFTITFIGTEEDVKQAIDLLSIDKSNTLAHDNTKKGVKMSYEAMVGSTVSYRTAASRGKDVTHNFFSKQTGTL